MGHENKCGSLHGHNGVLWIHASPFNNLDSIGRVVDFSIIKEIIGAWVDEHWDHTMIVYKEDKKTIELLSLAPSFKPIFILDENPTAENMAAYLLNVVCPSLLKGRDFFVHKIVFWETENCYVEHSLNQSSNDVKETIE